METHALAEIALLLQADQGRVQSYLRSILGETGDLDSVRHFTETEIATASSALRSGDRTKPEWALRPGDKVRRRAIHAAYGGQWQGGIATPTAIPDILIFTSLKSGADFGYDRFEGLREDGSYAYTGEGQSGDQQFSRGNKAIRDSARNGRAIRLFRTEGVFAEYVGSFTTGTPTYELKVIPDKDGHPRRGIIFNLVPVDAQVNLLSVRGRAAEQDPSRPDYVARDSAWARPDPSDVALAYLDPEFFDRTMSRVEFQLQLQFGEWLTAAQTPPRKLSLRTPTTTIEPDFYVPSRRWIVEAKKSTARGYVRTAIGQVLDYVHIATNAGLLGLSPVILLPGTPESDLLELMTRLGITVVIEVDSGFTVLESNY